MHCQPALAHDAELVQDSDGQPARTITKASGTTDAAPTAVSSQVNQLKRIIFGIGEGSKDTMLSDRTQEPSGYLLAGSPSDSDVLVWGTTYATEICGDRQRLVSYDSAECAAGSTRALPSHDGTIVATHRIVRRAEASIRTVESFVASPKAISLSTSDASYGPLRCTSAGSTGIPRGLGESICAETGAPFDARSCRRSTLPQVACSNRSAPDTGAHVKQDVSGAPLTPRGLGDRFRAENWRTLRTGSYRRDRYPPGGLIDRSAPELAHS